MYYMSCLGGALSCAVLCCVVVLCINICHYKCYEETILKKIIAVLLVLCFVCDETPREA